MKNQFNPILPGLRKKNRQGRNEFKVVNRRPRRPENLCLSDVVNFAYNASKQELAVLNSTMAHLNGRASV